MIRRLMLKDGKMTAVYGKRSFADFDLKSGDNRRMDAS
jgi:hypothetical protein